MNNDGYQKVIVEFNIEYLAVRHEYQNIELEVVIEFGVYSINNDIPMSF